MTERSLKNLDAKPSAIIAPIYCKNVIKINYTNTTTSHIHPSSSNESLIGDSSKFQSLLNDADSDDCSEDSFDVVEIKDSDPNQNDNYSDESPSGKFDPNSARLSDSSGPITRPPLSRQFSNILLLLAQYNDSLFEDNEPLNSNSNNDLGKLVGNVSLKVFWRVPDLLLVLHALKR